MASNEIQVRGLSDLAKTLDQLPAELRKQALRPALKAAGQVIADEAQRRAPRRTGELAAGIVATVKVDSSSLSSFENYVAIRSTDRKSHLLEFGAKAHKIIGRLKYSVMKLTKPFGKARRWRRVGITNERNTLASPQQIFGKSVQHPGTRPEPFMRPAFDATAEKAIDAFKTSLRDSIIRVVKRATK